VNRRGLTLDRRRLHRCCHLTDRLNWILGVVLVDSLKKLLILPDAVVIERTTMNNGFGNAYMNMHAHTHTQRR